MWKSSHHCVTVNVRVEFQIMSVVVGLKIEVHKSHVRKMMNEKRTGFPTGEDCSLRARKDYGISVI